MASAWAAARRASQEGHGHKQKGLWALLQTELVLPKSTMCPDQKVDLTMKDRQNICFQEESVL